MDLFRFTNPTAPTLMERGELLNGFTSKMWIERYSEAGEFTLVAPVSSGMKEKLPIGSFISHTNTPEIMIVENQEIKDDSGKEPVITITGRGFETFLENRIIGSNITVPAVFKIGDYPLTNGYTWQQITALIRFHIDATYLIDDDNALPYVVVNTISTPAGAFSTRNRKIKRDTLYKSVLDLLAIDDLGIKVVRPGTRWVLPNRTQNVVLGLHVGVDRTQEVAFSYESGEVINANYLWSNKQFKNAAFISGTWIQTSVKTPDKGINRRWLYVDATEIDEEFDTLPAGGAGLDPYIQAMQQKGLEALMSYNDIALINADVSKSGIKSKYRVDFDVGDYITVHGDYNESSIMRVTEYVEIEDENGESGYPTLTGVINAANG